MPQVHQQTSLCDLLGFKLERQYRICIFQFCVIERCDHECLLEHAQERGYA